MCRRAAMRMRGADGSVPDLPVIAYHHARWPGATPPADLPPQYVVELFDRYAERFDDTWSRS